MSLRRCRDASSFRGMGGLADTSPSFAPLACAAPAMMFRSASASVGDLSEPVYRGLRAEAPPEEEDVRLEEAEISLGQVRRMMGKAKKAGALGGSGMSATASS